MWIATLRHYKTERFGKTRRLFFGLRGQLILARYLRPGMATPLFKITRRGYGAAIADCVQAGIPHWVPHQLRHAAASAIREEFGIEMAQHILGHSGVDMTLIYAQKSAKLASEVALRSGRTIHGG